MLMVLSSRRLAYFAIILALPLVAACGVRESRLAESGSTLSGTVTYQGEKVEFAFITVQGKDGGPPASGKIHEDGRYKVENVPLGEVTIGVNTIAGQGEAKGTLMAQNAGAADPSASKRVAAPKLINVPPKYINAAESGIKTTIQKGSNTFDIKIE
jgi:hypothetical protein